MTRTPAHITPRHRVARASLRRRRGSMLLDVGFAMLILAILLTVLAGGVATYRQSARRLGAQRVLIADAERALESLRAGATPEFADGGVAEYEPVSFEGQTPEGFTWLRVRVTRGNQSATLAGIVPRDAAARAQAGAKGATP